jgi:hypothetical protein
MVANVSDIVSRMMEPGDAGLSAAVARKFLACQFSELERQRVAELLEKNNANVISRAEQSELQTLVVLSDIFNVLHAQARLFLKNNPGTVQAI